MGLPIELPILFHTDETSQLKKVGVDYSISDCEERNVLFFNINAISPYIDEDRYYSTIHANGDNFICPMSYDKVRKMINDVANN